MSVITAEHRRAYAADGFTVVRGLFEPAEIARYRDHFMALRGEGAFPGDLVGVDPRSNDPLKQYPRMIHMHRWDELSLRWLLDARLNTCLTALLGIEPFAVQTMLYFKPPGARGQAPHQDQYYLRVSPGTCIAAWLPLDDCDEANGCLQVVPGSHAWPLLCTEQADTSLSFTDVTVPIPPWTEVRAVTMRAGDVLFFHGQLVHGSQPNRTSDRFRRSLIGHYIQGDARQVATFYHPALRMDGTPLELAPSPDGGACGVWVEREGRPVIELSGTRAAGGRVSE
ncbi:MAG TPA: phytanoyl-CoA dioxygenase family protein [Dehalococcoidia bacterium]|nr:phytanoyl-CoA dioxygenase family protein [Dehalococcoidia bacterium]